MLCIETPNISHYYLYNAVILSEGFLLENPSHLDLFGSSFWHGIIWCVHQDLTWHLSDVVVERKDFAFTMFGFYISVFISSIRKTFERIFLVPNWILVYEEPFHTYLFCLLTENPPHNIRMKQHQRKIRSKGMERRATKIPVLQTSTNENSATENNFTTTFWCLKVTEKEKTFHFNHFHYIHFKCQHIQSTRYHWETTTTTEWKNKCLSSYCFLLNAQK